MWKSFRLWQKIKSGNPVIFFGIFLLFEAYNIMQGVVKMNFEIPDRETPTEKLLYQRISALEERLEQMRLSRRVLLRILEQSEEDKKNQLLRLEKENTKLQRQNCYFAKSLMAKNNEIMNLSASVSEK
jgi:hypothetical protein